MDGRHLHVMWCTTDEVDWSRVTAPWLSSLPPDEVEVVMAAAEAKGGRHTRLLARVMQRTAVAAAVAGLAEAAAPAAPLAAAAAAAATAAGLLAASPHQPRGDSHGSSHITSLDDSHSHGEHAALTAGQGGGGGHSGVACSGGQAGTWQRWRGVSPGDLLSFTRNRHGKPFLTVVQPDTQARPSSPTSQHTSSSSRLEGSLAGSSSSSSLGSLDISLLNSQVSSSSDGDDSGLLESVQLHLQQQQQQQQQHQHQHQQQQQQQHSQQQHTHGQQACVWAADLGQGTPTQEADGGTSGNRGTGSRDDGSSSSLLQARLLAGQQQQQWPSLAGAAEPCLQFNLSHTHGLVGCVVAPAGVAVGLDVERRRRSPSGGVMALARRRFAPAEVQALQACPDEAAREELFAALWTLKEAFVKARGTGISAPPGLRGFAVGVREPLPTSAPDLSSVINQLIACQHHHRQQGQHQQQLGQHQQQQGQQGQQQQGQQYQQHQGHSTPAGAAPCPVSPPSLSSSAPLVHITLDLTCTPQDRDKNKQEKEEEGGGGGVACGCLTSGVRCGACPDYHLMLLQPSEEHIAALCVALPRHLAHLWPTGISTSTTTSTSTSTNNNSATSSQTGPSGATPSPFPVEHQGPGLAGDDQAVAGAGTLRLSMWRGVPGGPQHQVALVVGSSPSSAAMGLQARVLGCTTTLA